MDITFDELSLAILMTIISSISNTVMRGVFCSYSVVILHVCDVSDYHISASFFFFFSPKILKIQTINKNKYKT